MTHKFIPTFLPLVLMICLTIGIAGNLIKSTGIAVLIVAILALVGIHLTSKWFDQMKSVHVYWGVGIGLLVMLIGQIFVLSVMPNTVYHDPYRVLSQADQMAAGYMTWDITYFWRYANNVPLTYFMSLWLRFTQLFGLSTNLSVHLLSILTLDGFILLALCTVWQLSRRHSTLIGAFAFFALTPFAYTYYLQVFYSDLPTILILLVIMKTLLNWSQGTRNQHLIKGAGLVLTALAGLLIKANLIVILPALAIVLIILGRQRLLHKSQLVVPVILIALGFGLSLPATKVIDEVSNYHTETKFEFPVTNWILMGYNSVSNGGYSGSDVGKSIRLPSKAARQQHDLQTIPQRLKRLGVFGVLRLWTVKLGILLNVRGIQNWYNGGFRSAPSWYHNRVNFFRMLTTISYAAATIVLWIILMLRLITWRPNLSDSNQVIALLAIVTALGYLAFHTLLWEVEPRYGQAILPLSWIALAALPHPQHESIPQRQWQQVAGQSSLLASMLVALGLAGIIGKTVPQNQVVAAQRSQLSVQYHAKQKTLKPGVVLTEDVDLHAKANYFSVQIHAGSTERVTLTNLKANRSYTLYDAGSVYRLHHQLRAGRYRITVRNNTNKHQLVDVVHTYHYRLATHPLIIDGHSNPTASFVFTCMQRVQKKG